MGLALNTELMWLLEARSSPVYLCCNTGAGSIRTLAGMRLDRHINGQKEEMNGRGRGMNACSSEMPLYGPSPAYMEMSWSSVGQTQFTVCDKRPLFIIG